MSEQDINGDTLSAADFTVVIPLVPHKERTDNVIPILWAWAENILEKEKKQNYDDHDTNMKDRNQNTVFDVNLGLYDFGYLKDQEDMGKLLVKKKLMNKRKDLMVAKFVESKKS